MPLVTATFSTGGSVVITDEVEVAAINSLTAAVTANTAMLEKLFGSAASTASVNGITAAAINSAGGIKDIGASINGQTKAVQDLTTATTKISNSVEVLTRAAATIQYTMTQQLTTQQLMAADQIKNNQFQQVTTNAALQRANLPPTEVPRSAYLQQVTNAVQDISIVKAQTFATNLITESLTDAGTKGFTIAQAWVVESAFGKWVSSYYSEAKLQAQILFADDTAKITLREQLAEIRSRRLTPAGGE